MHLFFKKCEQIDFNYLTRVIRFTQQKKRTPGSHSEGSFLTHSLAELCFRTSIEDFLFKAHITAPYFYVKIYPIFLYTAILLSTT
jgi:hypothetical protein